jgi:Tol biopolymer transport system component
MRRLTSVSVLVAGVLAVPLSAGAPVDGDNGRVAFRKYLDDGQTRGAIFTVRSDGSGLRQLTHPPSDVITTEPDWSPNGHWIVYHRQASDISRIFKIRPNGTHRTSLSQKGSFPAWSPHGRRIAFQRDSCGAGATNLLSVYVMRADGTHIRRVTQKSATCATSHRLESHSPQWAPSGNRLAFERLDHKRELQAVFTVRLDGTGARRLTPWRMDAAQPDWSPNGRWIAFRTHEQSDTKGNIGLVHPDGTGLHLVTHGGDKFKWLSCSFSPNGNKITAARVPGSGQTDNADVYTMRLDGSDRVNLTQSTNAWESAPDWGPRRR